MSFKVGDRVRIITGELRGTEVAVVSTYNGAEAPAYLVSARAGESWYVDHGDLEPVADEVNHPSHYTWGPVEVIEITERLGFCLGNVIKYVLRADHKGKPLEDLEKAQWYLTREIARRKAEQ